VVAAWHDPAGEGHAKVFGNRREKLREKRRQKLPSDGDLGDLSAARNYPRTGFS